MPSSATLTILFSSPFVPVLQPHACQSDDIHHIHLSIHGSHQIHHRNHGDVQHQPQPHACQSDDIHHIHHIPHRTHGDVQHQPQPHACQSDDIHHIHHIHLSIHRNHQIHQCIHEDVQH